MDDGTNWDWTKCYDVDDEMMCVDIYGQVYYGKAIVFSSSDLVSFCVALGWPLVYYYSHAILADC